ncbi:hypothetical protein [Apilactobacillus timberlakei]|uniref:hypothetical protein n=1 Tax=Apilactobacillus timberlakei TaxID=2008380 RepID=UPI0011282914|nr:hypothetical protein [Apilactobacillus timberlakei]TPR16766.1 hypothetical protein DYZ95_07230 [Apilactobacillus timberlakei]TPR21529.1 hypothetical protein DY083_05780 [Apilactobacillus timberlakei]
MAEKVYSRQELETEIELFKPELIKIYEEYGINSRFNKQLEEQISDSLIDLYNIYLCLKDFKRTNFFKAIKNNFYKFAPAQSVKHGKAVYK